MTSQEYISDDEGNIPHSAPDDLVFVDKQIQAMFLGRLNTLRKGGEFCDVTFTIGTHTIPAHRVLLACVSKQLFKLFSESESRNHGNHQYIKLDQLHCDSFEALVNYVYTSRLKVTGDQVKSVYRTAVLLKMGNVAEACAQYLTSHLTPANCLGIRAFSNSYVDEPLTAETDIFIQNNFDEVLQSAEKHRLHTINVNIMGIEDIQEEMHVPLSRKVVEYLQDKMEDSGILDLTRLAESPLLMYFNGDSGLVDCQDITDAALDSSELIQDYKRNLKRKQITPPKGKDRVPPSRSASQIPRQPALERPLSYQREWRVIATKRVGDKQCTCIAILGESLATLTVKLHPYPSSPTTSINGDGGCSPAESASPLMQPGGRQCSLVPLASMSSARCGVGSVTVDGKLIALGGYDRGECLNTVEAFDLDANAWTPLPPMLSARGRFDVAQVQGTVYACGGSNGERDLQSAECYDSASGKWRSLPNMPTSRSSPGVAALGGKLYVVGGWSGYSGLKLCEVYDPQTDSWSGIADLNTGRSQTAVCAFNGHLVAAGGCDAWNSIDTVETYDPKEDKWTVLPHMVTCRRGAGLAVFKDKLYVIGGSDGQRVLASVEIYDPSAGTWSNGPALNTPRANIGVAFLRDWLFVVGGFSGKMFLDTTEYLAEDGSEWCDSLPLGCSTAHQRQLVQAVQAKLGGPIADDDDERNRPNENEATCNGKQEAGDPFAKAKYTEGSEKKALGKTEPAAQSVFHNGTVNTNGKHSNDLDHEGHPNVNNNCDDPKAVRRGATGTMNGTGGMPNGTHIHHTA